MLPVIVIAAMVVPYPDEPPVCLDDMWRFNVSPTIAHLSYELADEHQKAMEWAIEVANSPEVVCQWRAECQWRKQCWSELEDVLFYESRTNPDKLRSLWKLRSLIGHEAYYAGKMPFPTPNYNVRAK